MKYTIGAYIHDERKRKGYTQEELAEGICTTSTLSKIENGSREPSAHIYEALMQRLGEPASLFSAYLGRGELVVEYLCRKLLSMLAQNELTDVPRVIEEYEAAVEYYRLTESRLMQSMKVICHAMLDTPSSQVLQELYTVLQPENGNRAEAEMFGERKLFTFEELLLWNNIAIQYKRLGNIRQAEQIWIGLKDYLEEKDIDGEERARFYPVVLYNLAGLFAGKNEYIQAVFHSETAIKSCVDYGKLFPLPYLLCQKGNGLMRLGKNSLAAECFQDAERIFRLCRKEETLIMDEMIASF